MEKTRKLFSVCIPAYNRAHHLTALLDSVLAQRHRDFEIVICEDASPERAQIAAIVRRYQLLFPDMLHYFENERNLGYDGNIRKLVAKATGQFCFFMGNDDIMCADALEVVASLIHRYSNVGLVLKSYAWFDEVPDRINQEVRYFNCETEIKSGPPAIRFAFRRSGVISGYIVHRDAANDVATSKYDGTLYYQLYLTSHVLISKTMVCTPKVLVLCRNNEPPEFGNSNAEKGKYIPGGYTPDARLNMIGGALLIIRGLKESQGIDVIEDVIGDYANYFYPYIKDQLTLPLRDYWTLYRRFGSMGFRRYPLFHVYFAVCYLLGEKNFDLLTSIVKKWLGRSPHF